MLTSTATQAAVTPVAPRADVCVQGEQAALRVGGLVAFSTADFPDRLAAVVFLQGCPWRCGYCHNPHLIPAHGEYEQDWPATLAWLAARRGLLDAVVFSGGEPTAQPALTDAVRCVRALGFEIGLHTGGAYPRRLAGLLPYLGWIGLDIKADPAGYARVTGNDASAASAFASLDLLRAADVAFEVRTTIHPLLTPPATLVALAEALAGRGITRWVLQRFRPMGCADQALAEGGGSGVGLEPALLADLAARVGEVVVR